MDDQQPTTATILDEEPAAPSATTEVEDVGDPADTIVVEEVDVEQRAVDDGRSPGQLLAALELAEAQRDEYLDALQRGRAEFDNYRKRAVRESTAARTAGVGDLAAKLLDALDDVDRTVDASKHSADDVLAGGIAAVQRKLADTLGASGVERIDATEVPFDASRHEAVQQVPADEPVEQPVVDTVLRPGYLLGDRVLRAAMVVVRQ